MQGFFDLAPFLSQYINSRETHQLAGLFFFFSFIHTLFITMGIPKFFRWIRYKKPKFIGLSSIDTISLKASDILCVHSCLQTEEYQSLVSH